MLNKSSMIQPPQEAWPVHVDDDADNVPLCGLIGGLAAALADLVVLSFGIVLVSGAWDIVGMFVVIPGMLYLPILGVVGALVALANRSGAVLAMAMVVAALVAMVFVALSIDVVSALMIGTAIGMLHAMIYVAVHDLVLASG